MRNTFLDARAAPRPVQSLRVNAAENVPEPASIPVPLSEETYQNISATYAWSLGAICSAARCAAR
jgi:hypothetical protein